ncbi:cell division protein FtsX [Pararcticibacter amylolyticus]|uniref:Cell division protein FtsX n=1 Tax=Pararcticibacter amylolyticus TaxID=2173175 RepID=A0A2U2PBE3_9SPHI|nr:permease-like cell division protein FtsX [Pararcticibacter amylolyticus]PWG78680.1 cell division protein FtsX [Pararcticibacter amylolyticus]
MEEFEVSASSRKTKQVYISTVISIALVLLMIGLLGLMLVHARNLSNYVKENIVLNIIVSDGAKEVDVLSLQKQIDTHPYVLHTQYVSKEIAAQNLQKDLGEDFLQFLGYNPLLSTIDVYMKAEHANNESIQAFSNQLTKNPLVKEVIYQKSLIDMVNQNIRIIGLVILAFAAVLLIIAVALINNTIRLAIYSQRFLIKSMQLVGATRGFIRRPFLGYGILHGFLGGLIAVILLLLTLYLAQQQIPELIVLRNWFEFGAVFAAVVIIGILISGLSTYFAVSKYLRLKIYNLYR